LNHPFSFFLAVRYLKPKRSFVSVISVISVLGVAIGVWALIVVLSVMTGFGLELRRKVLGFEAHLTVGTRFGTVRNWEKAQEKLEKIPGIVASSPYVMGPALLEFEANFTSVKIRGIEPESEEKIANLAEYIKQGKLDLDGDKCLLGSELSVLLGHQLGEFTANAKDNLIETPEPHGLAVGARVRVNSTKKLPGGLATNTDYFVQAVVSETALRLSKTNGGPPLEIGRGGSGEYSMTLPLQVGEKILLNGPKNLQGVLEELKKTEAKDPNAKSIPEIRQLIQPMELEVSAIFETGRYQYDSEFIILPLHLAQILYGFEGEIHGLTVRTKDPEWAHAHKDEIAEQMGEPYTATSWIDQNAYLFDAIAVERGTMSVILFLIVGVAAFAIMNTLITVTVLKRKEIGVLKALGSPRWQITRIFVYQGAIVGLIGILVGLVTAFITIAFRNEFRDFLSQVMGIQILPKSVYQLSELPAEIVPSHIIVICVASFLACLCAGLLPAIFAARLDPVKALREE
jgi:ABC-type lipoprotein release transport system permease subunit